MSYNIEIFEGMQNTDEKSACHSAMEDSLEFAKASIYQQLANEYLEYESKFPSHLNEANIIDWLVDAGFEARIWKS